jgi:hypothetical protein
LAFAGPVRAMSRETGSTLLTTIPHFSSIFLQSVAYGCYTKIFHEHDCTWEWNKKL